MSETILMLILELMIAAFVIIGMIGVRKLTKDQDATDKEMEQEQ